MQGSEQKVQVMSIGGLLLCELEGGIPADELLVMACTHNDVTCVLPDLVPSTFGLMVAERNEWYRPTDIVPPGAVVRLASHKGLGEGDIVFHSPDPLPAADAEGRPFLPFENSDVSPQRERKAPRWTGDLNVPQITAWESDKPHSGQWTTILLPDGRKHRLLPPPHGLAPDELVKGLASVYFCVDAKTATFGPKVLRIKQAQEYVLLPSPPDFF
jgi:hypothetical protein